LPAEGRLKVKGSKLVRELLIVTYFIKPIKIKQCRETKTRSDFLIERDCKKYFAALRLCEKYEINEKDYTIFGK
jgi:hypothetical protein